MEQFKFVIPTKEYEMQAIEYIKEFKQFNSSIHGVGSLEKYLDNYDNWLLKIEKEKYILKSEEKVPAETYFFVRENDNKIVGMINIRLQLNKKLINYGGNIGYCIRPTERQKGYNKINMYLGLLICKKHNINSILMFCNKENLGSKKTILSFNPKLISEKPDNEDIEIIQCYEINVEKAIEENKEKYENEIIK